MADKHDSVLSQYEIPRNSISCFIARICEDPGDNFEKDGILWVDTNDLDGSEGGPKHGEDGTTQRKAIASWTLRAAYTAWDKPPKIKFKGTAKMKGRITMNNAVLSNVNLSGGPPLMGVANPIPLQVSTPFVIASASGTAKIEQTMNAEIEMSTDDNLDIELTSQKAAQLPWCVDPNEASEGDNPSEEELFIQEGDMALCLAFGNSLTNLYVVDILK